MRCFIFFTHISPLQVSPPGGARQATDEAGNICDDSARQAAVNDEGD